MRNKYCYLSQYLRELQAKLNQENDIENTQPKWNAYCVCQKKYNKKEKKKQMEKHN